MSQSRSKLPKLAIFLLLIGAAIVATQLLTNRYLDRDSPVAAEGAADAETSSTEAFVESRPGVAAATDSGSVIESDSASDEIPIPSEFTDFVEAHPALALFHDLLSQEPEDAEWARRLEQAFRDRIAQLSASEIIVQSVECRTYSCELLASGYSQSVANEWVAAMTELFDSGEVNEWALGTGIGRCDQGTLAPGVFALHCIYSQESAVSNLTMPEPVLSVDDPHPPGTSVVAIEVSDSAAAVIEADSAMYSLHRQLETETRDAAWAEPLEAGITDYFDNLPDFEALEVTQVECRATLCEVHLSLDDPPALPLWYDKASEFHAEGWHDLDTVRSGASGVEGDRSDIVWVLRRR